MVSVKKPKPVKMSQKPNKNVNKVKKNPELKVKKEKSVKILEDVKTTVTDTGKKKVKYVMPSKYIKEHVVNSCLDALDQLAKHYKKKNTIFEDETSIFAELHCIKIQNSRGNIKFVLPHSTVASTKEICLITPDLKKGRKVDHEPTVDHWEEILRKAGVTEIKTILPLRQLKVEYDQFELKRRLLTQHDFILVDTRVLNHASHLLGQMFFKKHNMLIPVRIDEKANIQKNINIGLRTAMLRVNEGETSTIIVGHTGMPREQLRENVLSLVEQLHKFPGGQANIRSIALKLPLSLSLPLYVTLRPSSTVIAPPKMSQKKPKNYNVLEGELSTYTDRTVRVAPDGTVKVVKPETKPMDTSDTEEKAVVSSEDEEQESDQD